MRISYHFIDSFEEIRIKPCKLLDSLFTVSRGLRVAGLEDVRKPTQVL
jgi:hypothetical protein